MTTRRVAGAAMAVMTISMAAAAPARTADDWVSVSTPDGAFHYAAPAAPTSASNHGTDGDIGFSQTNYTSIGNGFIEVGDETLYDKPSTLISTQMILKGFVAGMKAELVSSQDQPYARGPGDTLPGVLAVVKNDKVHCQVRIVIDAVRIYGLAACGIADADAAADIAKAIASFNVTTPSGDAAAPATAPSPTAPVPHAPPPG